MKESPPRLHLAIALVSFAVLFYQVAITRVLSVVLWYHFAFLSVSLALLGIGAPGVWFAWRRGGHRTLENILLATGAAIPLSILAITKVVGPLTRTGDIHDTAGSFLNLKVVATVVAVLVPFLGLGGTVCILLLRAPGRRIGAMYGADLLGATLGAALVVPFLHVFPTPSLLAACGFLPLAAALLVSGPSRRAAALSLALLAAILWGEPFRLHHTKKYAESGRVLFEKWTPTGRITVFPDIFYTPDPSAAFAWGMGDRYVARPVEQLWIEQDGSAGTPVTRRTGSPGELSHLFFDVTSVGYQLASPRRVCVIGAGGGRDVLAAQLAGAETIDAVELNSHIVRAVSGRFREYSGDVYGLPGVRPVVSEGRSFLTRTHEHYDLIQISMVDSWAATSAGAFALSENYLYTVEAFRLYWDRLTPNGLVSVSRWMMDQHLVEGARLVLLAKEALARSGVAQPERHLVVVQAKAVATLLVSRQPFDQQTLERVDRVCEERGFLRHWPPHPETPRHSLIPRLLTEGGAFLESSGLDVSPPTDDRPFFFQAVPILGRVDRDLIARLSVNEQSVILLRRLLLVVGALTLALFFLPFALSPRWKAAGIWSGSAYFASIGLAFLLVEVAWVQRFILYLGHPSYATTVVLAAMLLGAGLGSITARKVALEKVTTWGFVLPLFLATINFLLSGVLRETLGWGFGGRVFLSALLLLPSGFLMGFGFPFGMIRFGDEAKPWYWALNGAFSVLGSVSSLGLAMLLGHAAVAYAGVVFYAIAYLLLRSPGRRRPRPARGGRP